MKALYHYKIGLVGYFDNEADAERIMKELGGVFQWENPNFIFYEERSTATQWLLEHLMDASVVVGDKLVFSSKEFTSLFENAKEMEVRFQKNHAEDLISTIESNAIDNVATITNVKLWAESWRNEIANYQSNHN